MVELETVANSGTCTEKVEETQIIEEPFLKEFMLGTCVHDKDGQYSVDNGFGQEKYNCLCEFCVASNSNFALRKVDGKYVFNECLVFSTIHSKEEIRDRLKDIRDNSTCKSARKAAERILQEDL